MKLIYNEGDKVRSKFEIEKIVVKGESILITGKESGDFFASSGPDIWVVLEGISKATLLGYKEIVIDSQVVADVKTFEEVRGRFE